MASNPTRADLSFFSDKKELFGLLVLPCFIVIGLRVFMNTHELDSCIKFMIYNMHVQSCNTFL